MNQEYIQKLEARISELELTVLELKRLVHYRFSYHSEAFVGPHDQLLTVKDVVELIGLPRHIICDKAISGEIPSFKIGKQYKFSRNKVLEWFEREFDKTRDVEDFIDKYLQRTVLIG